MNTAKKDIRKLSQEELETYFNSIGEKTFRAKQVYEWLWKKNAHQFDDMTNLSKSLRETLGEQFMIQPVEVDLLQKSNDGTIKNAVKLHDGNIVESVLIPTDNRTTACVSSQVGCSLDCTFCATARLKRMRNLTAAEIVDQVVIIDEESKRYFNRPLSNIVFMGMGEPLLNYNEVISAIKKITTDEGLGMSPRRITLSTSGIPKMIEKLADEDLKIKLAVSLHAAREEVRNLIMPFSVKFPLSELAQSLEYWYAKTKSKVTFEYIVWNGINDKKEDVEALVKFCKRIPSKVNIIEYNAIDDGQYQQASEKAMNLYIDTLEKNNIVVNVRRSRGKDIDAACGQLANKSIE
ncbi:23S rRNA (adenine(2503)-C(2))-methyltransferase RlmN [Vaginella massiliensis]|uniref:23S rRNA (adenine(2503)-C(2))-methyltransferase RlmN n=1 Tax=Vaginella massiliensis TaxID=1816680 RepID=UPI000837B74F|nr:23S rRNA (adenine(2503)-C(2))-methyltransferase RlmN [Vaginella massiliensis]